MKGKRKHIIVIIALFILLASLGGVFAQRYFAAARRREQQVAARLYTVTTGDLKVRLLSDGTAQVPLTRQRFAVSGVLAELLVAPGDLVSGGQLVARLDDKEYNSKVREAQTRLREAQVRLDRSRQQHEQQLQSEFSRLQGLKYQLETEETRYLAMLQVPEAFTAQELELRRLSYNSAQFSYDSALTNYERLLRLTGQFALEELAVEQALAAYRATQENLAATQLRARQDGKVMSLPFAVGDTITTSADFIALGDPEDVKVTTSISELDISSLYLGQQANIEFDALSGQAYTAQLISIEPLSVRSGNLVNYTVSLKLDEPPQRVRPGMSATITFLLGEVDNVLLLPAAAIRTASDGVTRVVDVRDEQGNIRARPVTLGLSDGRLIEIVEGVKVGERVLIR